MRHAYVKLNYYIIKLTVGVLNYSSYTSSDVFKMRK